MKLTIKELEKLKQAAGNQLEWITAVNEIRESHEGNLPSDWVEKVIKGKLYCKKNWR